MESVAVHINQIKAGDTIIHNGKATTVCYKDISYSSFMGKNIFGDSYNLGQKSVVLVTKI